MKEKISVLIFLFIIHFINAQQTLDGQGKSYIEDINQMFSAAPTSNNLMKFEEVPVSYYTGIPDISIPLVNIPTNNKNVNINVQLKYHPLNAKPDDRSGETGLGWSLMAGGSIVRTVRGGNPDEKSRSVLFSSPPKTKFGIYEMVNNPTSKIINNDPTVNLNDYSYFAALGKYDTEYDLYQYNFLDKSGRFYVVKNSDNTYTAVKLDKNNLKITCYYDSTINALKSFTITDDKGIKYDFEGMEKSQKSIANIKTGLIAGEGDIIPSVEIGDYYTSYHLVRINDQNSVNLVTFKYDVHSEVKFQDTPTTTYRTAKNVYYTNTTFTHQPPDSSLPGSFERQIVYNTSQTYLLTSIEVRDKGTVYLSYEKVRSDTNYSEPQNLYKLKSVQSNYVTQPSTAYTDKYILDYDYSDTAYQTYSGVQNLKKLLLKKITKVSPNDQNSEYNIDYNTGGNLIHQKDSWGFYKDLNITTDVIKSIAYPTRGKVVFNFGTNQYSYNPVADENTMVPVTGYTQFNSNEFSVGYSQFSTTKNHFFTTLSPQTVTIDCYYGNLTYYSWKLTLYKKTGTQYTEAYVFNEYQQQSCPGCPVSNPYPSDQPLITERQLTVQLDPGEYYVTLTNTSNATSDLMSTFVAHTNESVYVDQKIKNGGGLRINNISYFENALSDTFSKKYMYSYDNIEDPVRSSGALVFPEPKFNYSEPYSYKSESGQGLILYQATFDITTDYNIFPVQKTQGGDVGYKYVTVEQIDNSNGKKGKKVYKFRSPLDYPNESLLYTQMPIIPIPNQDYLRGQTIWEKNYDAGNNLLSQTDYQYNTTEYSENDGIKIKDNFYNNIIAQYYQYSSYQDFSNLHGPIALTSPYRNFEKFGATLPVQKTETSYFYENGAQSSVTTTTNTAYNAEDYPVSVTQNIQGGDTYVSTYKYAKEKSNQRLINANMIGIPLEMESRKNNQVKDKTETFYEDLSHLFPSSVKSYDIQTGADYTELTYEKYDGYGNLLQYRTKDGTPVSVIWGYNNTKPIAKVEGMAYTALEQNYQSQLAAAIQASNTDAAAGLNNDESNLLNVLEQLRNSMNVTDTMITTYTYDPIVGIRSVTQPSKIMELYYYDSANRLKEIRQKEVSVSGAVTYKTVKEFQYNYKN